MIDDDDFHPIATRAIPLVRDARGRPAEIVRHHDVPCEEYGPLLVHPDVEALDREGERIALSERAYTVAHSASGARIVGGIGLARARYLARGWARAAPELAGYLTYGEVMAHQDELLPKLRGVSEKGDLT